MPSTRIHDLYKSQKNSTIYHIFEYLAQVALSVGRSGNTGQMLTQEGATSGGEAGEARCGCERW